MKYLCSICALAPADTIAAIEGFTGIVRARPVCWPCCSPVPEPRYYEPVDLDLRFAPSRATMSTRESRDAILAAVGHLGAGCTTGQIAERLGVACVGANAPREERRPYDALVQRLVAMCRAGYLDGAYIDPANPRRGKLYSVGSRAPSVEPFRDRWGLNDRRVNAAQGAA